MRLLHFQSTVGETLVGFYTIVTSKIGMVLKPLLIFAAGIFSLLIFIDVINIPFAAPLEKRFAFSYAVFDAKKSLMHLTLTPDEKYRVLSDSTEYPDLFVKLLLRQEDTHFYRHFGVNPVSLIRGIWETYVAKNRKMGGSTITMQTARLLFDFDSSTIAGKVRQIFLAVYLEVCWTKKAILRAYSNLVPCGKNIEGFYSGSLFYFGREIASLTPNEMMTLIVIPQNPNARDPSLEKNTEQIRLAVARLYERAESLLSGGGYDRVPVQLHPFAANKAPQFARHFSAEVIRRHTGKRSNRVLTTLNTKTQKVVEETLRQYLERVRSNGVQNAAIFVADYTTMDVVAYVGSADFFDASIEGQVDGLRSARSPGSTLKPFVYLKAADKGLVHSETRLKDAPTSFGTYSPDNYRSQYTGIASASYALATSRNIPAIELNRFMYSDGLYELLHNANVPLKNKDHYGLSIVVGGAEITAETLTQLYCALANSGVYKPLLYTTDDVFSSRKAKTVTLSSANAAYMVKRMLATNVPERFARVENAVSKTGTSTGFRDAWTAGIADNLVIVVWIGNFDGSENVRFVGGTIAQPLFFSLVNTLRTARLTDRQTSIFAQTPDMTIKSVLVCAVSGNIPQEFCTALTNALFIPRVSSIEKCTVHRPVYVDKGGFRTDFPSADTETVICEFWDSDVIALLYEAGRDILKPPPYQHELPLESQFHKKPRIREPLADMEYIVILRESDTTPIQLRASADLDTTKVSWFIDGKFIASAKPEQTLRIALPSGEYKLTCSDEYGFTDTVQLKVTAVR